METLQNAYRDDDDDPEITTPESNPNPNPVSDPDPELGPVLAESVALATNAEPESNSDLMEVDLADNPAGLAEEKDFKDSGKMEALDSEKVEVLGSEDVSSDSISESEHNNNSISVDDIPETSELKKLEGEDIEEDEETTTGDPASNNLESLAIDQLDITTTPSSSAIIATSNGSTLKKSSKKKSKNTNCVWTKPTSRKYKKKAKNFNGSNTNGNNGNNNTTSKTEDSVLVTPIPRIPDRNDDSPESKICLSKVYKAEKVELSDDRLSAGSCKGYRMVRATRGVSEGAWFFEVKIVHLGESGHTRLGWSTERGDLQAPVGYDGNSFGYRDVDGSKVHKALREKYGDEGYKEGDVIGFYINLPDGDSFAPKGPHLVMYKGQKYVCASGSKEDPPKSVPGSEISFFKNGVCQGVAFKDVFGGRYYPAASMYTLPNQPNCMVKFNFGPDFECFPADFEGRPFPKPMIEVPYHGYDNRVENGALDENKQ